jgi:hypothetical protein
MPRGPATTTGDGSSPPPDPWSRHHRPRKLRRAARQRGPCSRRGAARRVGAPLVGQELPGTERSGTGRFFRARWARAVSIEWESKEVRRVHGQRGTIVTLRLVDRLVELRGKLLPGQARRRAGERSDLTDRQPNFSRADHHLRLRSSSERPWNRPSLYLSGPSHPIDVAPSRVLPLLIGNFLDSRRRRGPCRARREPRTGLTRDPSHPRRFRRSCRSLGSDRSRSGRTGGRFHRAP